MSFSARSAREVGPSSASPNQLQWNARRSPKLSPCTWSETAFRNKWLNYHGETEEIDFCSALSNFNQFLSSGIEVRGTISVHNCHSLPETSGLRGFFATSLRLPYCPHCSRSAALHRWAPTNFRFVVAHTVSRRWRMIRLCDSEIHQSIHSPPVVKTLRN